MSSSAPSPRWWQKEDWLSVLLGFAFIALALFLWQPAQPSLKWKTAADLGALASASNLGKLGVIGGLCFAGAALTLLGMRVMPHRLLPGFAVVFLLGTLAQGIAGNGRVNDLGLEHVIFGLGIGLFISNVTGLPAWMREAVRTEFYIKTGLVLLGATILFQEIMQAGALGIIQAVLVVSVVWYFAFWLCRKFGVDDEFATILSTAVSICGVSAAIAACGAIQGDRKKLSYTTSLVLICAVPMMILMPWAVKAFHIPELVGGAWLGGTLDTSGSVVAAGALISEPAMKAGVIVKFSQNVLLGVAAFMLSVWWTMRQGAKDGVKAERPGLGVIWERFPKFVIGFVLASLVFSFLIEPVTAKAVGKHLGGIRNFWFAMAFVSIGLETRFKELLTMENGRPAFAFLGAQAFNVVWTLVLAWLLFGDVLFPAPEIK